MPVVAVIGAIAAIGIAAEVGTTLAIVAAVGATIGAVGAVTNNKALMIAGGVIGAIGGIGALAQSAGIIGADAFSFGSTAAAAGEGAASGAGAAGSAATGIDAEIAQWSQYGADLSQVAPSTIDQLAGAPELAGAPTSAATDTGSFVNDATGAVQPIDASTSPTLSTAAAPDVTPAGVQNTQMAGQEVVDPSTGQVMQGDGGGLVEPPSAPSAPTITGDVPPSNINRLAGGLDVTGVPSAGTDVTGAPATTGPQYDNVGDLLASGTTGASSAAAGTSPGVLANIWDLIKTPGGGRLVSGVLQAGSSFIAGATNGLTPAQIAALNAQAEANQAAANMSNLQQANLRSGVPVASRVPSPPVTGAPAGMINTPPRPSVTGATA